MMMPERDAPIDIAELISVSFKLSAALYYFPLDFGGRPMAPPFCELLHRNNNLIVRRRIQIQAAVLHQIYAEIKSIRSAVQAIIE